MSISIASIDASFESNGKGKGTPYTTNEKSTARQVILCLLVAVGEVARDHEEIEEITPETLTAVNGTIEDHKQDGLGIPNLARRAYTRIQNAHVDENGVTDDAKGWPKRRDYTSIGLIFRGATKGLTSQERIDTMFPRYQAKKKDQA